MDLNRDLLKSDYIVNKARAEKSYAQNIYAALCNMRWCKITGENSQITMDILKDEMWSCSWRSAGGIVSQILGEGDYLDWYCSGMGGLATIDEKEGEEYMSKMKYVPEGEVTEEIANDFKELGWAPIPWPKDN